MLNSSRETIYSGAFAYFSGLTSGGSPLFNTATRKLKTWEQVPPEDQPALLFRQRNELAEARKNLPTKWIFNADLYLYVHTGAQSDPDVTPSQLLNPLIDAIEASLTIDDFIDQRCTIGGLVTYIAIDGALDYHLGAFGDEAVAIVPIRIVVNT